MKLISSIRISFPLSITYKLIKTVAYILIKSSFWELMNDCCVSRSDVCHFMLEVLMYFSALSLCHPLPCEWKASEFILFFSRKVVINSSATPWTVVHQALLSVGFSQQECWSRLSFPSPGDIPDPGKEPASPAIAGEFLTTDPPASQSENL